MPTDLQDLLGLEGAAGALALLTQFLDVPLGLEHLAEVILHRHSGERAPGGVLGDLQRVVIARPAALQAAKGLKTYPKATQLVMHRSCVAVSGNQCSSKIEIDGTRRTASVHGALEG